MTNPLQEKIMPEKQHWRKLSFVIADLPDEHLLNHLIGLEDGCSDPDMKDNIQTLRLLISIFRPFLKFLILRHRMTVEHPDEEFHVCLRHIVGVVRKVNSLRTNPDLVRVAFYLENLKNLKEAIGQIVNLLPADHMNVRRYEVECLIQFHETLLQNLKDVGITRKAHVIAHLQEGLSGLEQRLKLLATSLVIAKPLLYDAKNVVRSSEILTIEISCYLLLRIVDDDELVTAGDHMREDRLPYLLRRMKTLLQELRQLHHEYGPKLVGLPDHYDLTMKLLGFLDSLIYKLRELSSNRASSMFSVKTQIDILVDQLGIIRSILRDILSGSRLEAMESLRISIEALLIDAGFFIYFYLDNEGDEELVAVSYLSFGLPDLLEAVYTIHIQARDVFHKKFCPPWPSKFVSMGELELVDFLSKNLEGLLDSKAASIDALNSQIRMVQEEMVSLRKYNVETAERKGDSDMRLNGTSQMEIFQIRLMHAAYLAEYVIDSLMAGEKSLWLHTLGISVIIKGMKLLQKEVKTILNASIRASTSCSSSISASTEIFVSPSTNAPSCSEDETQIKVEEDSDCQGALNHVSSTLAELFGGLVGIKDSVADIIWLLTQGSPRREILSIVGLPGLGKTTLANAVYKHPSVCITFHVRAWCCLSRVYHRETLLSSILDQICPEKTNQIHESSGKGFPHELLYQSLKGRKYLIVIDDIWDIDAWVDLHAYFPDDCNGSRILFTTRNHAVAKQAESVPYALRLLSSEESCELIWLKLLSGESCPQELLSISMRIANSCKGLPLAVVLVAGVLKRTERRVDSWERVAKTLIRSRSIQEKILEVMEVSYKHLPEKLKPCFRYFGTFPEGNTIVVSKMIKLWISEGFVQQKNLDHKSLKQEAESYLNDLIDRSLVKMTRKSSTGGVKACSVNDVLHEFCSAKLEKERYVTREEISGGMSVLYGDYKVHSFNLLRMVPQPRVPQIYSLLYYDKPVMDNDSRLIENPHEHPHNRMPSEHPHKRTPLSDHGYAYQLSTGRHPLSEPRVMFRSRRSRPDGVVGTRTHQCRYLDYGSIVKFKNLKVLDLGNVHVRSSVDTSDLVKIAKLVHLIYLAVRVRTTEIPSEIGDLRNLETFHLSGAIGKVMLPEAIWKLESLREIIMDHCFFNFQNYSEEFFEHSSQLDNLNSVSTLSISHRNVETFMRRLSRVQKLGCVFSNSWHDYYEASSLFKILELLYELESVKMSFHSRAPYPFQFKFPSNLKKLAMSKSRLPWDEISIIGQLPNLEVLKLLDGAFEGLKWDMQEGEFQKLKFLKLDSLDVRLWSASSEHLPCLEQLVVVSCKQLEEIPSSFGEIPTLQLIEMKWCCASATDSVKQILEAQRDLSNNQLNVIVAGS